MAQVWFKFIYQRIYPARIIQQAGFISDNLFSLLLPFSANAEN